MSLIQSLRNIFSQPTPIVDDQGNELSKSDISRIKLSNSFATYYNTQYIIEDIQKSYNEDLEELNELAKGNEAVNNRLEAQISLLDERLIKSVQLANKDQNKALEELKKAIDVHASTLFTKIEQMNKAQVYKTGRFLYEDKLESSLGRKRDTMPQIDSANIDDVVLHFQGKSPNTKVTKETISADKINFVQGEMNEDKILAILKDQPKQTQRFLVAKDKGKYYILDGNHRYCALCELDPEMPIDTYVIHLDPIEAIRRLNLMKISSKSDIKKSLDGQISETDMPESTIYKAEQSFLVIEKAFNHDEITVDQFLDARQKYELIKARSGVYADNAINRRLNRVGQKFGSDKKSEEQSPDKAKKNDSESTKTYSDSELSEHAKNASQADLERQIKEGNDSKLRSAAHKELDRRSKEEHVQDKETK